MKRVSNNKIFMELWDWEANHLSPETLLSNSNKKVKLHCKKCHEKYEAIIINIFRSSNIQCKYCSGRQFKSGVNDVKTLYKDLMQEWDYEKNSIQPANIGVGCKYKIWWKCFLGHNWEAFIYNRVSRNDGCPYCSGKRLLKDFNTLNVTHGKLLNEWDYERNTITPNQVTFGMRMKVHWKCLKHGSYAQAINKKTGGQNCPKCSNSISKGEKDLLTFMRSIYGGVIITSDRNVLNGRELDIYLPDFNIAIEYNGDYWHSSKSIRFSDEAEAHLFHKRKFLECLNNNIILLTVWEEDWINSSVEIKEFIKEALIFEVYSPVFFKFNSGVIL